MTNFKRLQVKNFQSHEILRVEFDPAVTVFVGPSDAGKSAIIWALRWVAQNRPLGDAFLRHGADTVEVKTLIDDRTVLRRRGRDNAYQLDDTEYKAFGDNPPEDVARVFNLDEINFQGQHDAPFWFSLTAGEVARRLNKIVDLGVIDSTNTYLAGAVRDRHAKIAVLTQSVADAKAGLDGLAYVPVLVAEYDALEVLQADCVPAREASTTLSDCVFAINKRNTELALIRKRLKDTDNVAVLCWEALAAERNAAPCRLLTNKGKAAKATRDNGRTLAYEGCIVLDVAAAAINIRASQTNLVTLLDCIKRAKAARDKGRMAGDAGRTALDLVVVAVSDRATQTSLAALLDRVKRAKVAVGQRPPDITSVGLALRAAQTTTALAASLRTAVRQAQIAVGAKVSADKVSKAAKTELQTKSNGRCPICQNPLAL